MSRNGDQQNPNVHHTQSVLRGPRRLEPPYEHDYVPSLSTNEQLWPIAAHVCRCTPLLHSAGADAAHEESRAGLSEMGAHRVNCIKRRHCGVCCSSAVMDQPAGTCEGPCGASAMPRQRTLCVPRQPHLLGRTKAAMCLPHMCRAVCRKSGATRSPLWANTCSQYELRCGCLVGVYEQPEPESKMAAAIQRRLVGEGVRPMLQINHMRPERSSLAKPVLRWASAALSRDALSAQQHCGTPILESGCMQRNRQATRCAKAASGK